MRLAMQSKKKEGFCRLNMSKMRKVRNKYNIVRQYCSVVSSSYPRWFPFRMEGFYLVHAGQRACALRLAHVADAMCLKGSVVDGVWVAVNVGLRELISACSIICKKASCS